MLCSEEVATSGPLCRTLSTPASGWCAIYEGTSLDISARSCSALQGYRGAVAPSLPLLKQGLQLFQWYLQWPFVSSDIFRFFMFLKLFGDLAQGVQFIILGPTWEETKVIAFAPQELPCQEHLCGSAGLAAPGLLSWSRLAWGTIQLGHSGLSPRPHCPTYSPRFIGHYCSLIGL